MVNPTAYESSDELVQRALREYETPLVRYAVSILGDYDRAKDVVQDTFLKLYHQEPGKVQAGLKSWLFTVCRNRAFDVIRKEKRMIVKDQADFWDLADKAPSPSKAAEKAEAAGEALRFLARLPKNQQEVIRLKFQSDLSYKEISEITKLSVSNVGFLIHTGLKRLRTLMTHQVL